MNSKVIIVGNGPAGISAALYTVRAGIETTVIGKDTGTLDKAAEVGNYYGFEEPIAGKDLVQRGINQAKNIGTNMITSEVLGISYDSNFIVQTKDGDFDADSVIIATGSSRKTPRIKGLKDFEGTGVSYCAVCDAFFYRGKDVAVLGNGDYAIHEAKELLPIVNSVTILTDGKEMETELPEGIKLITDPIAELTGTDVLTNVVFKSGSSLDISGLFIAMGVAGSADLAKKIGAITDGNKIVVDQTMSTNVPGLYAAGDCTGGMLQIAKAVYDGALAGTEVVKYLRKK